MEGKGESVRVGDNKDAEESNEGREEEKGAEKESESDNGSEVRSGSEGGGSLFLLLLWSRPGLEGKGEGEGESGGRVSARSEVDG